MKLQIALDVNKKKALSISKKVIDYIDIIEIGTLLIKQEGFEIIKDFKKFKKPILADLKTMDTGFLEAETAFKAGADIVTICGCSNDVTIKQAIKATKKYKKKILVDTINVKDIKKRTKQLLKLKPDIIAVHLGIDLQKKGKTPLQLLKQIPEIKNSKTKLAVAGGVNLKNIKEILKYGPDIIIIGSAITKSKNPEKIAKQLKESIK
jgi:3-hexulose-6-phosphate synthase